MKYTHSRLAVEKLGQSLALNRTMGIFARALHYNRGPVTLSCMSRPGFPDRGMHSWKQWSKVHFTKEKERKKERKKRDQLLLKNVLLRILRLLASGMKSRHGWQHDPTALLVIHISFHFILFL